MTPDEIHQLGLAEVARIRSEMEKVKATVGFTGDLNAFFEHVRNKPELMPFDDPQQVIDNFNAIYQKVLPKVNELFSLQPKTPFEYDVLKPFVRPLLSPNIIREHRRFALWYIYVPIRDVKTYNTHQDEALHEAIPGHHFQISLQQENTALPSFRKNLWYAYGEGGRYTPVFRKRIGTVRRSLPILWNAGCRNAPCHSLGSGYGLTRQRMDP